MSLVRSTDLNVSNSFSALRMLLALPASYAVMAGLHGLAIGICVIAAVTDMLDGYLARRLNQVTDLGKMLDPFADKVFIAALVLTMITRGLVPLWFALVVLTRDTCIFLGGLAVKSHTGVVLMSNYTGKITVVIVSLLLLLVLITGMWTENIVVRLMMWTALFMMTVSVVVYAKRAARVYFQG